MSQTKAVAVIALAALVLALIPMDAAAQATGTSTPNVRVMLLNQNPDPAKAGDVVEIRLRLQNTGTAEARDIWLEFVPEYPFTLLTGDEKRQIVESLPHSPAEENSRTITFKLRADREAIEGQYKVKFRASLNEGELWVGDEFSIDVTAREFAEIIYIDKTKLLPGKETEMTFTIHNTGNAPLQNVIFSWNEPNSIVLPVSTDNTRFIEYLGPGENTQLKYTVIASVNAKPDLYQLNLNLEFDVRNETKSTVKKTISTKAGIFIGGETDFDVTFSESSQGQTSLSLANVGRNPAYSVTVRIPQQQGFRVQGSSSSIVGNLDKGDFTIVSFRISQSGTISGGFNATDRERFRRGDIQPQNMTQTMQNMQNRSSSLRVQIEYTDTTGVRQSVEKSVSMQSMLLAGNETMQGMSSGRSGGFSGQQPSVDLPLIGAMIVVIVAGIFYLKKRKSANALAEKILKRRAVER